MVREKVTISTRTLQWKCVELRKETKRLSYGRFILAPLLKGQADTIGIAMRRALLGETEGTCITRAKFEKIPHEFSTLTGIQESVQEILMNLKEIVLKSYLYGTHNAYICVKGPRDVTAEDIILPTFVEIIDNTQHIATISEPIDLYIELQIERNRGYHLQLQNNLEDRSYPIDAVFMPVRNTNFSVHSYGNGTEMYEILFLEIWTNGSLTPKEALHEASRNLIDLFMPFLHAEEESFDLEKTQNKTTLPLFTIHDKLRKTTKEKEIALKYYFIDQAEFSPKIYNSLKKSNIHTLWDLLNKNQEELLKIQHFGIEDVQHILRILEMEKDFAIDLRKNLF
uniref:DNA-directed RNA polymerase subunit alpha n=1 Tax=Marathrum foeniculaceum TaxID=995770 RepID=A0A6M8TZ53_9ROSI|nr:RNA polymerase alpha subunit [Marathrum foeniculaceum]QKJ81679.1 RNA polymerase alpha subunit [Marathrum foeniculaceum]